MQSSITVTFNGKSQDFTADSDGRFNLNQVHELSNESGNRRPGNWMRAKRVQSLIEKYSTAQKRAVLTIEGQGDVTGTWAVEEVFFAYTAWLNPEFHKVVLDTFTAATHGDGVKAVQIASKAVQREATDVRNTLTSQMKAHGARGYDYPTVTDQVYVEILGGTAAEIRLERGLAENANVRKNLPEDELLIVSAVESLATAKLMRNRDKCRGTMINAISSTLQGVKAIL